jgi:hypothetical protein
VRGLEHVHAKHRGHLRNDERHGRFAPLLDLADDRHGESGQVGELGLRQMTGAPQTHYAPTGVVLRLDARTVPADRLPRYVNRTGAHGS